MYLQRKSEEKKRGWHSGRKTCLILLVVGLCVAAPVHAVVVAQVPTSPNIWKLVITGPFDIGTVSGTQATALASKLGTSTSAKLIPDPVMCVPCAGGEPIGGPSLVFGAPQSLEAMQPVATTLNVDVHLTEPLSEQYNLNSVYLTIGSTLYKMDLSTDSAFLSAYAAGEVDYLVLEDPFGVTETSQPLYLDFWLIKEGFGFQLAQHQIQFEEQ